MWIVMASSESRTSVRIAELMRLQEQRARANGHKPGEMAAGADIIVIRSDPETHRREYDLLKWGFVPSWALDQVSLHLHAR